MSPPKTQLDSLLRIVEQQGANELRLGSDKAPTMFAGGAPKKLTIPATPTSMLRELFGGLVADDRWGVLDHVGRVEFTHQGERTGAYRVTLTKRPGGTDGAFDALVMRSGAPTTEPPVATGSARPPPQRPAAIAEPQASVAQPAPGSAEPAMLEQYVAHADAVRAVATGELVRLIGRAAAMRASDVHLADDQPVAFRIDGRLERIEDERIGTVASVFGTILGDAERARLASRTSVDLALDVSHSAGNNRCRVNVYATSHGLAAAVRLLPSSTPALLSLGFPVPIGDLVDLPNGLCMLTGPTGCGKSTTLAALAAEALRRRPVLLVTLEDPIEHVLEPVGGSLVRQRQVGRDVRDFATGLRDALREDPDVLLIGEMRDVESITLALTAAETGHLVLASLHARNAVAAVERIVDVYPPERQAWIRVQLADVLRAVVAQRLVPSQHGQGRLLAAEVLRVTTSVGSAIREGKMGAMRSAMQSGRADGMITLERSLADLVRRRAISLDVARRTATDPSTLDNYLREGG